MSKSNESLGCAVPLPEHIHLDHVLLWLADHGFGSEQAFANAITYELPLPAPVHRLLTADLQLPALCTAHDAQQAVLTAYPSRPLRLFPRFAGIDYSALDSTTTLTELARMSDHYQALMPVYASHNTTPPLANTPVPPAARRELADNLFRDELARIDNGGRPLPGDTNDRKRRPIYELESTALEGGTVPLSSSSSSDDPPHPSLRKRARRDSPHAAMDTSSS